MADNNCNTSFDNAESGTKLSDFKSLKPFDIEPKKKVMKTIQSTNPRTFWVNKGLAITTCLNVIGFVSRWKQRKKVSVARTIPKFHNKIKKNIEQKQSLSDVLQNNCSWKFCKLHRKTLVLESLLKRDPNTDVFLWTYFREHLRCLLLTNIRVNWNFFSVQKQTKISLLKKDFGKK